VTTWRAAGNSCLGWPSIKNISSIIFDTGEGEKTLGEVFDWTLAAARVPLYVRPQVDGRVPGLLATGHLAQVERLAHMAVHDGEHVPTGTSECRCAAKRER
jgi:hypothetical protein